jgi:hypothetical protein
MELNLTRLTHTDPERKSDDELAAEAKIHLAGNVTLQVTAEFIRTIRRLDLKELDATVRRGLLTATERMQALAQRPDSRQLVTTTLAGVPPKAARRMDPNFQASLLDQVVDSEDRTAEEFDEAFNPDELVVYCDASAILNRYLGEFRWEEDTDNRRDAVASLIEAMLKERGAVGGKQLRPILTYWDVLSAISPEVWHTKVPLEVRIKIHQAWLEQEHAKPRDPFTAKQALEIADPRILVANIALIDLHGVVKLGLKKMGFELDKDEAILDVADLDPKG